MFFQLSVYIVNIIQQKKASFKTGPLNKYYGHNLLTSPFFKKNFTRAISCKLIKTSISLSTSFSNPFFRATRNFQCSHGDSLRSHPEVVKFTALAQFQVELYFLLLKTLQVKKCSTKQ